MTDKKMPALAVEKLGLHTETVRELSESEAEAAKGGGDSPSVLPACPTRFCTMACPSGLCAPGGRHDS